MNEVHSWLTSAHSHSFVVVLGVKKNVNTTALQVHTSGKVPCPARVSRSDVAALAVASALFSSDHSKKKKDAWKSNHHEDPPAPATTIATTVHGVEDPSEAFHYTLGVRWVGENLHPYPGQGQKQDGYRDADTCLRHALKILRRRQKNHHHHHHHQAPLWSGAWLPEHDVLPATINRQVFQQQRRKHRRRLQPYGICTAVPVYLFLSMTLRTLARALLGQFNVVQHLPVWMIPAAIKVQEIATIWLTFLLGQWYMLRRVMPSWLTRQASKKYISF